LDTLTKWDTIIARSILARSNLNKSQIHTSCIHTILKQIQLTPLNPITKAIQLIENTTGDHELTKHYQKELKTSTALYKDLNTLIHTKGGKSTIRLKEDNRDTRTTKLLKCLATAGIAVCPNKHHKTRETTTPNKQAKGIDYFFPNISLQSWDRTQTQNAGTGWGPSSECTTAEDDLNTCTDILIASSQNDTPLTRKLAELCCSYL